MQPEPPAAALRLDLDAAALLHNWRSLDALSSASVATGAAVKADAYGLGARRVVPLLAGAGCSEFFVAHWREAAALLDLLPVHQLSVLHGPLRSEEVRFARDSGVRPVINSLEQAARWNGAGGGLCHLMVDTGINRLGLPLAELGSEEVQRLQIDMLMSHLAAADEDSTLNALQLGRFEQACKQIPHRRTSLANSAGIGLGPAYHAQLTRPGLSLYGGSQRPELASLVRQVAQPMASVIQIRQVKAGQGVGYNATFIAPADLRAGIVALGYADGYLRCWSGKGVLRWREVNLPVIGRVSMDMTIVDLSAAPDLREGDWLEVPYDLPAASARSGLAQYELLTLLGSRFAR